MNEISVNNKVMTSTQLAELLGKQKKHVNEKIKAMFQDKIDGRVIRPSLDSRGYVIDYYLPELESKMFVAKHDNKYLEEITRFWIEKNKPLSLEQMTLQVMTELKARVDEQQQQIESKNQLIIASNEASIKAGEISVREFVKTNDAINIGGNKFLEWLRDNGIIMKNSRQPMQQYVDNGWLTWKFSEENINGRKRRELKIMPRGQLEMALD